MAVSAISEWSPSAQSMLPEAKATESAVLPHFLRMAKNSSSRYGKRQAMYEDVCADTHSKSY